jgi:uncharacterized protein (TIGR00725 family)
MKKQQIGVIGSAGPEEYAYKKPSIAMFKAAEVLGKALAQEGAIVINGGKGGVMQAVCKGAKSAGGTTVAELSGAERGVGNDYVDVEIIGTDIGFRGPSLLVGMSDAIISLGGGAGTLQELAVAYRMQKPVILLTGYGGWTDRIASMDYMDERKLVKFTKVKSVDEAMEFVRKVLQ